MDFMGFYMIIMGNHGMIWEFMGYPLVICYVAIENHRNSGFSHERWMVYFSRKNRENKMDE